jgi:hypothetical protein
MQRSENEDLVGDCLLVIQYFKEDSTWAPAIVHHGPWDKKGTFLLVQESDETSVKALMSVLPLLAEQTGRPTRLVRIRLLDTIVSCGEDE